MTKRLSKELIRRIAGTGGSSGGSYVGGGGGGGGVSQSWVDENYIGKEFFNQLFIVKGTKTTTVGTGTPTVEEYTFAPNEVPSTTQTTEEGVTTTIVTAITNIEVGNSSLNKGIGLWTSKFLSALGLNGAVSGGGGGTTLNEPLLSINAAGLADHPSSAGQTIVWNGSTWVYGNAGGSGGGTVTRVGMTVPTGLSVSPSAITTSGTFIISFASGYSIPTIEKQNTWDAAYNVRHTHTNKSVIDGITSTKVSNWDAASAMLTTGTVPVARLPLSSMFWGNLAVSSVADSTKSPSFASVFLTGELHMNRGGAGIYFPTSGAGINWHNASNQYVAQLLGFAQTGVGVGRTPDAAYKLDVSGDARVSRLVIGSIAIEYDSTNNALKIVKTDGTAANIYATGGVAALQTS